MRFTLYATSLLLAIALGAIALIAWPRANDSPAYRALRAATKQQKQQGEFESRPAIQERLQVQKDLWLPRQGQRIHYCLKSEGSHLTLVDHAGHIEALEKLSNLTLDALDGDTLRRLTAVRGSYSYPSHLIEAESTSLALYQVGQETPFLTGHAALLHLDPATSTLTAHSVEGHYHP